jgi:hypothetical protein
VAEWSSGQVQSVWLIDSTGAEASGSLRFRSIATLVMHRFVFIIALLAPISNKRVRYLHPRVYIQNRLFKSHERVCWQGRGDRYDFSGRVSASGQRMHWQQPWQLSCRLGVGSFGSSPLPSRQIQVMFRPWMLPARGPRRSEQRNPAAEEGDVLSRPICRSTGASLVGGSNIPLASKGGRVGMPSPGLWVPERESQGAGVLVGVSFRRSSSGGRR